VNNEMIHCTIQRNEGDQAPGFACLLRVVTTCRHRCSVAPLKT